MSEWEPTMNLRFVKRGYRMNSDGDVIGEKRILQQEWVRTIHGYGHDEEEREWRDVPEVSDE